jgi:hypothetical protein
MCLTKCVNYFCIGLNQASLFMPLGFGFGFHLVMSFFYHVHLSIVGHQHHWRFSTLELFIFKTQITTLEYSVIFLNRNVL